jgi:hypothetical protein
MAQYHEHKIADGKLLAFIPGRRHCRDDDGALYRPPFSLSLALYIPHVCLYDQRYGNPFYWAPNIVEPSCKATACRPIKSQDVGNFESILGNLAAVAARSCTLAVGSPKNQGDYVAV